MPLRSLIHVFHTAPVTYILLTVNLLVSLIAFLRKQLFALLILHPYSVVFHKQYWRLITTDFVHVDWLHLLLNNWLFYVFGTDLEEWLRKKGTQGSLHFAMMYLVSLLVSSILTTVGHRKEFEYSSAGASGSITGMLFAFMVVDPHGHALSLALIGPVENIFLGPLYIGLLFLYKWRRQSDLINHDLHFYGALGGAFGALMYRSGLF